MTYNKIQRKFWFFGHSNRHSVTVPLSDRPATAGWWKMSHCLCAPHDFSQYCEPYCGRGSVVLPHSAIVILFLKHNPVFTLLFSTVMTCIFFVKSNMSEWVKKTSCCLRLHPTTPLSLLLVSYPDYYLWYNYARLMPPLALIKTVCWWLI